MIIDNQDKNGDNDIYKKTEIKSFVDLGSNLVSKVKIPGEPVNANVEESTVNKVQPVYITTAKPLINNIINIGVQDLANSEEVNENDFIQSEKVITLKPFVYIVTTAATTTPTTASTASGNLLSTESFFLEHNKIQEISLTTEGDPITPSSVNTFTQFNDGNFHNFMHNFGSTIDQVLFSDQNHNEHQSDKYFALFKDFQDFKSKHTTASPSPLSYLSSSTSIPTTTTTLTPPPTTQETYQVHTTSKINILKNLFKKIIPQKTLPVVKTPVFKDEEEQYTEEESTGGIFNVLIKGKEIVKERISNIGKII